MDRGRMSRIDSNQSSLSNVRKSWTITTTNINVVIELLRNDYMEKRLERFLFYLNDSFREFYSTIGELSLEEMKSEKPKK